MKKRNKPVIPGFGLSMGITISILSLVVLIPLASLVVYTAKLSFKDFIETITRARVLASFYTSFVCAFAAAVINGIMGTVLAWVLVKVLYLSQEINPIIQKSHRWLLCQSFRNLIIQVQRQSHL